MDGIFYVGLIRRQSVSRVLIHRLDHYVAHHETYRPVLEAVYREIMLLGLLSFFMYLAEVIHLPVFTSTRVILYAHIRK